MNHADQDAMGRLGVGPMSKATIAAMSDVAETSQRPIMAIASRRQIDHRAAGGGYVENWTTEQFANKIRDRDAAGLIRICRDHGGPWQQPARRSTNVSVELAWALESFKSDLEAGFDLIHIDTSKDVTTDARTSEAIERLLWLYSEVWKSAGDLERKPTFEIGFEVQGEETNNTEQFKRDLGKALEGLIARGLPLPLFVVAQTGTKVVEASNAGAILNGDRQRTLDEVAKLADVCHRMGARLKAHNMDYLEPHDVGSLAGAGVDAINVAPEFGVIETRVLLAQMDLVGARDLQDQFTRIAVGSGRWRSWIRPNKQYSDRDLAELSGHYVLADQRVRQLRADLANRVRLRSGEDLEEQVHEQLIGAISGYQDAMWASTVTSKETYVG